MNFNGNDNDAETLTADRSSTHSKVEKFCEGMPSKIPVFKGNRDVPHPDQHRRIMISTLPKRNPAAAVNHMGDDDADSAAGRSDRSNPLLQIEPASAVIPFALAPAVVVTDYAPESPVRLRGIVKLTNVSETDSLAFKVKSNAAKSDAVSVKPAPVGVVAPGQTAVLLLHLRDDRVMTPPVVMVQSLTLAPGQELTPETWRSVPKRETFLSKLTCDLNFDRERLELLDERPERARVGEPSKIPRRLATLGDKGHAEEEEICVGQEVKTEAAEIKDDEEAKTEEDQHFEWVADAKVESDEAKDDDTESRESVKTAETEKTDFVDCNDDAKATEGDIDRDKENNNNVDKDASQDVKGETMVKLSFTCKDIFVGFLATLLIGIIVGLAWN